MVFEEISPELDLPKTFSGGGGDGVCGGGGRCARVRCLERDSGTDSWVKQSRVCVLGLERASVSACTLGKIKSVQ